MEYPKINSIYKRDITKRRKPFIMGDYATPEFEFLKDTIWSWTEKVDGTNIRIIFDGDKIRFVGKTDSAQISIFLLDKLQAKFYPLLDIFKEQFKNPDDASCSVILYGEGYGPKIQKGGGNYRKDVDFVLFDVRIGPWWLKRSDIESIAKLLNLDVVPIVGRGTIDEAIEFTRNGFESRWGKFIAEGLVLKPEVDLCDRGGRRIITKIKYKDFKEEDKIDNKNII